MLVRILAKAVECRGRAKVGTAAFSVLASMFLPQGALACDPNSPLCGLSVCQDYDVCVPGVPKYVKTPAGPVVPGAILRSVAGKITVQANPVTKKVNRDIGVSLTPARVNSNNSNSSASAAAGGKCADGFSCYNSEWRTESTGQMRDGDYMWAYATWSLVRPTIDTGDWRYDIITQKSSVTNQDYRGAVYQLYNYVFGGFEPWGVSDWDPSGSYPHGPARQFNISAGYAGASVGASWTSYQGQVEGITPQCDGGCWYYALWHGRMQWDTAPVRDAVVFKVSAGYSGDYYFETGVWYEK